MLYLWIFAAPLHLCDRGDFGVLRFYCLAYDVSFLWMLTQRKGFFPGLRFTPVARTLELCLYVPFLLVGLHFFFLFNDCTGVPDGPCRQGKGRAVCLLMQCAVSLALGKGLADIVCLHTYEIELFY